MMKEKFEAIKEALSEKCSDILSIMLSAMIVLNFLLTIILIFKLAEVNSKLAEASTSITNSERRLEAVNNDITNRDSLLLNIYSCRIDIAEVNSDNAALYIDSIYTISIQNKYTIIPSYHGTWKIDGGKIIENGKDFIKVLFKNKGDGEIQFEYNGITLKRKARIESMSEIIKSAKIVIKNLRREYPHINETYRIDVTPGRNHSVNNGIFFIKNWEASGSAEIRQVDGQTEIYFKDHGHCWVSCYVNGVKIENHYYVAYDNESSSLRHSPCKSPDCYCDWFYYHSSSDKYCMHCGHEHRMD